MLDKANTLASIFGEAFSIRRKKPIIGQPAIWYLDGTVPIFIDGRVKTLEIAGTTIEEIIDLGYKTYVSQHPVIMLNGDKGHLQVTEDGTFTFGEEPHQRPLDYDVKSND